jgi:hypothetical protein
MPPQLVKYWVAGAGAAKIRWGISGDFDRCVRNIQAEASEKGRPLSPHVIHGLCATLHKLATGATPGHAPGEGGGGHHHGRGAAGMASDAKKPYGDVTYADPGYQKDGKKRYPLDTEAHCRAAWSYINMPKNASVQRGAVEGHQGPHQGGAETVRRRRVGIIVRTIGAEHGR